MAGAQEPGSISLQHVHISDSSVAVGHGARAGGTAGDAGPEWATALAELRRELAALRASGELPADVADESLERADALEDELGREKPRRTLVFDMLETLTRAAEGVARFGGAVALVVDAVHAVLPR